MQRMLTLDACLKALLVAQGTRRHSDGRLKGGKQDTTSREDNMSWTSDVIFTGRHMEGITNNTLSLLCLSPLSLSLSLSFSLPLSFLVFFSLFSSCVCLFFLFYRVTCVLSCLPPFLICDSIAELDTPWDA
jgi:hypothetical protein